MCPYFASRLSAWAHACTPRANGFVRPKVHHPQKVAKSTFVINGLCGCTFVEPQRYTTPIFVRLMHIRTLDNYQGVELAIFGSVRPSNKVLQASIKRPGTHGTVAIALPPTVERSPKPLSLRPQSCCLCFFSALLKPQRHDV